MFKSWLDKIYKVFDYNDRERNAAGHATVAASFSSTGTIFGAPDLGVAAACGAYVFNELQNLVSEIRHGREIDWRDHAADIASAVAGAAVGVLIGFFIRFLIGLVVSSVLGIV